MIKYSKKVMDYFLNPKNMGQIKNPDGKSTVGNPVCGDVMELQIKINRKNNKDYIKDIKFQSFGCGAAIATSSVITEMAKGKTVEEAYKISQEQVTAKLDGLPPIKIHCSNLASRALKAAIENFQNQKGKK